MTFLTSDRFGAPVHEIENPGPAKFSDRARKLILAAPVAGAVLLALGLLLHHNAKEFWFSFLTNFFFFLMMALAGAFMVSLERVVNATWSVVFRRMGESFTAFFPFAVLGAIILLFGVHTLYPWADPVHHPFRTLSKQAFYSIPFFSIRTVLAVVIWTVFAHFLVKHSLDQDKNPTSFSYNKTGFGKLSTPIGRISAAFIVTFAYTFSIVAMDWVMSLQTDWISTMFPVYLFAGLFQAGMALVMILTIYMRRRGMTGEAVRDHHLVDLARMLHAFSIFMVYIGFAQYFLMWYANFPEETDYFYLRIRHGWGWVFVLLLVFKWALPFTILLNQKVRRNERVLLSMAGIIVLAEWFDVYWLIMPMLHKHFVFPGLICIGLFLVFLGAFAWSVTRFLSRNNTVPMGDPKLLNSVAARYLG